MTSTFGIRPKDASLAPSSHCPNGSIALKRFFRLRPNCTIRRSRCVYAFPTRLSFYGDGNTDSEMWKGCGAGHGIYAL